MSKNFITIIIGIFVALLVVELTLRFQDYHYVPLKIKVFEKTIIDDDEDDNECDEDDYECDEDDYEWEEEELGQTDFRPYHEREDQWVVYSPHLIWRPKKNYASFNAQGFKGKPVEKTKAPNEFRIIAIGDSNTAGPVSSFGWVEYLGQLLEKELKNVHMINGGVWGYSSWQGLQYFEELIKYQPDIVLVSFGANDPHRVAFPDKEYSTSRRFYKAVHHLRICQLLINVTDILALKKHSADPLVPRVSLSEYTENLNAIISLAKKSESKVILLTRPNIFNEKNHYHPLYWINFASQYNELTRKIAKKSETELIDIYSYFSDKKKYFADEGHYNDEGHKIAAKFIYDNIIEGLPK